MILCPFVVTQLQGNVSKLVSPSSKSDLHYGYSRGQCNGKLRRVAIAQIDSPTSLLYKFEFSVDQMHILCSKQVSRKPYTADADRAMRLLWQVRCRGDWSRGPRDHDGIRFYLEYAEL
jgi:hypothetical protein